MNERKISKNKQGSGALNILVGLGVGFLFLILLLTLSSVIIEKSNLDLANIKYLCLISLSLASFSASVVSGYKVRTMKGFMTGSLTSLIVSLAFLLFIIIINHGAVSNFTLITCLISIATGFVGGIIGANLKQ